jgi:hypothetical protein
MGLDRLTNAALLAATLVFLAAGCDNGSRPRRLLDGETAAEFRPVDESAVTQTRVVRAAFLGRRFASCLMETERLVFSPSTLVVERIGVFSQSLTFRDRGGRHLHACDGGSDPTGERRPPWCGRSVGRFYGSRLLDPRLDILCRDPDGRRLAYAWVEPVAGSHWIGVDQGSYTEVYEVAAGLPVRIATRRGIDEDAAKATFELTQYGIHGRELLRSKLEAAVAG